MDTEGNMKNYGLDLQKEVLCQSEQDWIFGAASRKCIAPIPEPERVKYLPQGEVQQGAEDTMDCATRVYVNLIEAKLNWLLYNQKLPTQTANFFLDNGYIDGNSIKISDAFPAINSNTTRTGNSLKAPIEAIRKQGLIPKSMLPLESSMTWDDYHDPKRITRQMRNLGKEFLSHFTINYERVYQNQFDVLLNEDMIAVAGFAWSQPNEHGEYPNPALPPNHAFLAYSLPPFKIFDNYIDSVDGDFTKRLNPDYQLYEYGYRVFLSYTPPKSWLDTFLERFYGTSAL